MEQILSGDVHGRTNPCPAGHDKCRVGHGFGWPEREIGNGSACDPEWPPQEHFPPEALSPWWVGFDFFRVLFPASTVVLCRCDGCCVVFVVISVRLMSVGSHPVRAKSWSPRVVARMDCETRHGEGDGMCASRMVLGGGFDKRPPNRVPR